MKLFNTFSLKQFTVTTSTLLFIVPMLSFGQEIPTVAGSYIEQFYKSFSTSDFFKDATTTVSPHLATATASLATGATAAQGLKSAVANEWRGFNTIMPNGAQLLANGVKSIGYSAAGTGLAKLEKHCTNADTTTTSGKAKTALALAIKSSAKVFTNMIEAPKIKIYRTILNLLINNLIKNLKYTNDDETRLAASLTLLRSAINKNNSNIDTINNAVASWETTSDEQTQYTNHAAITPTINDIKSNLSTTILAAQVTCGIYDAGTQYCLFSHYGLVKTAVDAYKNINNTKNLSAREKIKAHIFSIPTLLNVLPIAFNATPLLASLLNKIDFKQGGKFMWQHKGLLSLIALTSGQDIIKGTKKLGRYAKQTIEAMKTAAY